MDDRVSRSMDGVSKVLLKFTNGVHFKFAQMSLNLIKNLILQAVYLIYANWGLYFLNVVTVEREKFSGFNQGLLFD